MSVEEGLITQKQRKEIYDLYRDSVDKKKETELTYDDIEKANKEVKKYNIKIYQGINDGHYPEGDVSLRPKSATIKQPTQKVK